MTLRPPQPGHDVGINDRRLALELRNLIRRELGSAIKGLTAHRYGVVFGDPDPLKRTVAVQLYGLPQPEQGFVYGMIPPRDGDHVRVYIDPRGDKWIDEVLGRDSVLDHVVPVIPVPAVDDPPDRAATGIARVFVIPSGGPPALVADSYASNATNGGSLVVTPSYVPTAGNTRFLAVWNHDEPSAFTAPDGWVEHPLSPLIVPNAGGAGIASGRIALFSRVVQAGDAAAVTLTALSNQVRAEVVEFTGTLTLVASDTTSASGTSGPPRANPLGSVDVDGETVTIGFGVWSNGGDPLWAFTTDEGTLLGSGSTDGSHGPPAAWLYEISSGPATVAPTITLTNGAANGVAGLLASFRAAPASGAYVLAPEIVDVDDVTYRASDQAEAWIIDLGAAYRIARARVLIACETAGAKAYELRAATLPDYGDEVTLAPVGFTAAGAYATNDVSVAWALPQAYRYWRIVGPAETRRNVTVELREEAASEVIVNDPTGGDPAELNDVLAALAAAIAAVAASIITDHGGLSGLGDDDHPQYATDAEVAAAIAAASSWVPTVIASGETFHVPADRQALFAMTIDVEGILDVEGFLIEVD